MQMMIVAESASYLSQISSSSLSQTSTFPFGYLQYPQYTKDAHESIPALPSRLISIRAAFLKTLAKSTIPSSASLSLLLRAIRSTPSHAACTPLNQPHAVSLCTSHRVATTLRAPRGKTQVLTLAPRLARAALP